MPEWLVIILSLIAFVLILGVIICFHEFGHFIVAKKSGVLCHEFSFGMGPVIFQKKKGETVFSIRAFPIGGFVSMAGEEINDSLIKKGDTIGINVENDVITEIILDDNKECSYRGMVVDYDIYGKEGNELFIKLAIENKQEEKIDISTINDEAILSEDTNTPVAEETKFNELYFPVKRDALYVFEQNKTMQISPFDRSFESKPLWQRFLSIFAGPFNNLILALFIALIVSFCTGVPSTDSNQVGEVSQYYPANVANILAGDKIVKVNDDVINTWNDFDEALNKVYKTDNGDGTYTYHTSFNLVLDRNGEEITINNLEAFTYIQSIGITSEMKNETKEKYAKAFDEYKLANSITDTYVVLGATSVREKGGTKNPFQKIASIFNKSPYAAPNSTDILTGVKINDTVYKISSYADLMKIFDEVDVADVKFEYYTSSVDGDKINFSKVSFDDCATYEPYSNNVLENQRIEKIASRIGVTSTYHFDFFLSIGNAFKTFWNDFTLIFRTLWLLIFPSGVRQVGLNDLSSFVGIWSLVKKYVAAGILPLLSLSALLSVNIGVMNLLPIPALDGGRITFLIVEAITKKKPSKKVENIINNVFFILIMILFVYITLNDILKLF